MGHYVLEGKLAQLERELKGARRMIWVIIHNAGGSLRISEHDLARSDMSTIEQWVDPETGDLVFKAK